MAEVRTVREQKRDELYKAICNAYDRLKAEFPDHPTRIPVLVANEFEMTRGGVTNILIRCGKYQPRPWRRSAAQKSRKRNGKSAS